MTTWFLSACLLVTAAGASAQTAAPVPTTAPAKAGDGLPPGPGKAIAERMCTACHGLDVVTSKRATPDDWDSTVQLMVSRGADGTDAEIGTLTKYLAASFPAVKDGKSPDAGPAATAAETPVPAAHVSAVRSRFLQPMPFSER